MSQRRTAFPRRGPRMPRRGPRPAAPLELERL